MSEMQVVERRRPGRPRVENPLSYVGTRIPVDHHDKLTQIASANGMSVASLVRFAIHRVVVLRVLDTHANIRSK